MTIVLIRDRDCSQRSLITDRGSRQASVPESSVALPPETGSSMPEYRIYTIGRYGHFSSAEDIECADDQEAIQKAQQAVSACDVELWERRRFIARLPSKPTPK